jgi:hypothetical protein
MTRPPKLLLVCCALLLGGAVPADGLLDRVAERLGWTGEQRAAVEAVVAANPRTGQGNPAVTKHPGTPDECRARRAAAGLVDPDPAFEAICGAPFMAPLYDPATQRPEDATACIDQFEFPGVPCEYPIVWTKAVDADRLCRAAGKRLCDAHEWEGACAGELLPPDYRFDLAKGVDPGDGVRAMRQAHNQAWGGRKEWTCGDKPCAPGVCSTGSRKNEDCDGGAWATCGSNTYPTGWSPQCSSALGVWDLHGNAAEHMNLPLQASQMASTGATTLGQTEMKGSWFVWDTIRAHEDACRWRAPFWHGGPVQSASSHQNYHLGFRCCATLPLRP